MSGARLPKRTKDIYGTLLLYRQSTLLRAKEHTSAPPKMSYFRQNYHNEILLFVSRQDLAYARCFYAIFFMLALLIYHVHS